MIERVLMHDVHVGEITNFHLAVPSECAAWKFLFEFYVGAPLVGTHGFVGSLRYVKEIVEFGFAVFLVPLGYGEVGKAHRSTPVFRCAVAEHFILNVRVQYIVTANRFFSV